jgi:subtilase family serine protease
VSMLIKNEGTDSSGAFQVSVTCQGTTKLHKVRSIPGGTYKAVDVDFAPTDTGTDPNANVKVDPNNQVKETDETNNDFTITDQQCAPAP